MSVPAEQIKQADDLRNSLSSVFESELVPEHFQGTYGVELEQAHVRQLQSDGRLELTTMTREPLASRSVMELSIGYSRYARNLSVNEVSLPLKTGSTTKKHWLVFRRQAAGNFDAVNRNQYGDTFELETPQDVDDHFMNVLLSQAGVRAPVFPQKPHGLRSALARLENRAKTFSTVESIPIPVDPSRQLTVERKIVSDWVDQPRRMGRNVGVALRSPRQVKEVATHIHGVLEVFAAESPVRVSRQAVEYTGINSTFELPTFCASFGMDSTQASTEILRVIDVALVDYLFGDVERKPRPRR